MQATALTVLSVWDFREEMRDFAAKIGSDAFQPANSNRLSVEATAAAGWLARAIAGAAKNRRKHIRLPIDHIGVGISALGDQADVLGDVGVRRARPLAVDYFVEIVRIVNVCGLHSLALGQLLGAKRFFGNPLYTLET